MNARWTAGLATAALVVGGLGTWWWLSQPIKPKHIVLISMDTFRADHVGAMGLREVTTPHLDWLAEHGMLFERHVSAAPTTLASHTSLFTGTWPHTHGVPRNDHLVSEDNALMAEILAEHGFQTAAILGAMPLGSHSQVLDGFDHIDENFDTHRGVDGVDQTQRDGELVTDAALSWIDAQTGDAPMFVFVHYFDAHAPYTPPAPFREAAGAISGSGNQGTMAHIARTKMWLRRGDPRGKQASANLEKLYRAGAEYVDHQVGRLVSGLHTRGLLEETLIIVTSDHGETFDEHLEEPWDHGLSVYEDTVHTPLIVRHPNGALGGLRYPGVLSSIDLLPTLLDWIELPTPDSVEGVSFSEVWAGRASVIERGEVFSEATKPHIGRQRGWQNAGMQKAVRRGDSKLHYLPQVRDHRLYDLATDPGEHQDLSIDDPETTGALTDVLDDWMASANPLPSPRLSKGRIQAELAALGYVSDTDTTEPPPDGGDAVPPEANAPDRRQAPNKKRKARGRRGQK
ncbi:MAG: sulfatase [Myxococcota bacterium]